MRVLWTHNFDPDVPNAGIFMKRHAEGMRALGVDVSMLYVGNLRSLSGIRNARKLIRNEIGSNDILHAQYGSACALASAIDAPIKKVVTLRGSDWHLFKESLCPRMLHSLFATQMTRFCLDQFDTVVAVSNRIKLEVQEKYPKKNVVTIPSPVDLNLFRPIARADARRQLGFEGDNRKWVLITTISEINPVKRIDIARRAVAMASESVGDITLRVASGIPHELMPLHVSACDVILSVSTHEGWPNCIKEALACNVPFIATDVSDLREIAEADPSCRICPPDPSVIAKMLCDALSEPEKRASLELRAHVQSMEMVATCESLYKNYLRLVGDMVD